MYPSDLPKEYYTAEGTNPRAYFNPKYAASFVDVHLPSNRPFCDPPPTSARADTSLFTFPTRSFDYHTSAERRRCITLGRSVEHASEILDAQNRQFLLSISIAGRMVRFLRWDRSGAIVSEAFDCVERPEPLCLFLWRYAHLDDAGQGYGLPIEEATSEEKNLFSTVVREYAETHSVEIDADGIDYQQGYVDVIKVHDQTDPKGYRRCLVSAHIASSAAVASRATCGYWAVDTDTKEIGFLKDTWRSCGNGMVTEGEILQRLRKANVKNVPELICHGDVGQIPGVVDQRTRTNDYARCSWVCQPSRLAITPRVHYRMFITPAGQPLATFRDSKELLKCARDVYYAVSDAYHNLGLLHRDISMNNIVIVRDEHKNPTAYLIDWESSADVKPVDHPDRASLTGTWRYISTRLLAGGGEDRSPHHIYDDLESLLWVVLYAVLKYLPHEHGNETDTILRSVFDSCHGGFDGTPTGGDGKCLLLVAPNRVLSPSKIPNVTVREWSLDFRDVFYDRLVIKRLERGEGLPPETSTPERLPHMPHFDSFENMTDVAQKVARQL
ncbi:hypothetical protein BOTBODRAFT_341663 [Botryobasidium botryosum FD-172 SS1]|uniref:Protein kinase domain-containing protein n=1 Tax=Botryobasidium botryosum (strain FD-172 SS1) TaxID=930990 RepID=A0A067MRE3_BOTB1|nr:hypothetical protein BOTBODRAFT_341663 [Botryobasidium botryosum FD-172 SS1]